MPYINGFGNKKQTPGHYFTHYFPQPRWSLSQRENPHETVQHLLKRFKCGCFLLSTSSEAGTSSKMANSLLLSIYQCIKPVTSSLHFFSHFQFLLQIWMLQVWVPFGSDFVHHLARWINQVMFLSENANAQFSNSSGLRCCDNSI